MHRLKKQFCRVVNLSRNYDLSRNWQSELSRAADVTTANQLDLLKQLLLHAGGNVPYYRSLFAHLRFNPKEMKDCDDLKVLPVMTKDIIRREGDAMLAENFARPNLQEKSTGGSTGEPLVFFRHREYMKDALMGTWRNFSLCGWRPGNPIANFWGVNDPGSFRRRALKEELNYGMYTFNAFDAGAERFAEWRDRLNVIQPAVIYGYASTIWLFCKWLQESGGTEKFQKDLKGVFLTAERLHGFQRELIEETLGVHVFNLYGSTEIQNIAFECKKGSMHISSDFVVVEEGADSGLLLTSLRNYAMPFIRYRNGDQGKLLQDRCSCGINMLCMSLDISRTCDNFITESGRVIHGEYFTHLIGGIRGIEKFQFRQSSCSNVNFLVVPSKPADNELRTILDAVIAKANDDLSPELCLELKFVDSIEPTPMGKHAFTVSDVR